VLLYQGLTVHVCVLCWYTPLGPSIYAVHIRVLCRDTPLCSTYMCFLLRYPSMYYRYVFSAKILLYVGHIYVLCWDTPLCRTYMSSLLGYSSWQGRRWPGGLGSRLYQNPLVSGARCLCSSPTLESCQHLTVDMCMVYSRYSSFLHQGIDMSTPSMLVEQ